MFVVVRKDEVEKVSNIVQTFLILVDISNTLLLKFN
jgi:hypothetical protein